jgi:hypothetical protein
VKNIGLACKVHGQYLLIGDGVKESKEGRKIPGVKKLAQESENSSKPKYINGHMFGAIGILLGTPKKYFCTLLSMRLHDGNEIVAEWTKDELAAESHVVRLMREACAAAAKIGEKCRIVLDRYYLTVNALETLSKYGGGLLHIVTKAKKNAVAYEHPVRKHKRGAPPKKGGTIKLSGLFSTKADAFVKAKVTMYGKLEEVEYFVTDLLWGKKLYQQLRFVLVKFDGKQSILVSSDLSLSGEAIIEIYSLRFKIESAFRELKQVIAGFAYHFWSAAMPKLIRFAKNTVNSEKIAAVTDKHQKSNIISALKAIEGFVMFAVIAFGMIQMTSLLFADKINSSFFRWLKTNRNDIPSEATTADFMRKSIYRLFRFHCDLDITRFIQDVQSQTDDISIA